jgi:hypothetical protein
MQNSRIDLVRKFADFFHGGSEITQNIYRPTKQKKGSNVPKDKWDRHEWSMPSISKSTNEKLGVRQKEQLQRKATDPLTISSVMRKTGSALTEEI